MDETQSLKEELSQLNSLRTRLEEQIAELQKSNVEGSLIDEEG